MSRLTVNGRQDSPAPLVSVIVLAYNHLDYTRQCIDHLYRYTTDVDFELITINNGSSDGTELFFQSLPNEKKISFPENIGVDKAINYGFRAAEGKYTLNLSNDIIPTAHWLSNLVTCMASDEKIAMVVPVCGFSSNNQQVSLAYNSLDELQVMTKEYNTSDPRRWEERMRLVTYTCLFRTDVQKSLGGFDEDFNPGAYDDDAISFSIRRMGYKLMLAKDTYVHHFGSVTFQAEYEKDNIAERNKQLFYKKFSVHSWVASNIDFNLVELLTVPESTESEKPPVSLLGIGSSYGASLLQLKNKFRSQGYLDAAIDYCTQEPQSLLDLSTICRQCLYCPPEEVKKQFTGSYDVIAVEAETDKLSDPEGFFSDLSRMMKPGGQLITTAANVEIHDLIVNTLRKTWTVEENNIENYYFQFRLTAL